MSSRNRISPLLRHCLPAFAVSLAALAVLPGAHAEAPCADGYPCTFDIAEHALQRVPSVFKFQARISHAKFPVGDAVFGNIIVKVRRGLNEEVCRESFTNVRVTDSVLNLEIGRNISCDLDEVIAANNDLMFQVCIEGEENCLKPVQMATVPFAVKASFAAQTQEAHQADIAAVSHYAHRVSADRDLHVVDEIGTGYFDFYTHPEGASLYEGASYVPYAQGGFIQWVPVTETEPTLNICAKNLDDQLIQLHELVLHAATTTMRQNAVVENDLSVVNDTNVGRDLAVGAHATVAAGATVYQHTDLYDGTQVHTGGLVVDDDSSITEDLVCKGNARTGGHHTIASGSTVHQGLTVHGGATVQSAGLTVKAVDGGHAIVNEGNTETQGTQVVRQGLTVENHASISGGAEVSGTLEAKNDATVAGRLDADGSAVVRGGLTVVDGGASVTAGGVHVTGGGLTVSDGGASITGDVAVTGAHSITGQLSAQGGAEVNDGLEIVDGGAVITKGGLSVGADGADIAGDVTVSGTQSVSGLLSADGGVSLQGTTVIGTETPAEGSAQTLTVYAPTTFHGEVVAPIDGATRLSGEVSVNDSLRISTDGYADDGEALVCGGDALFAGNVTIGQDNEESPGVLTIHATTEFKGPVTFSEGSQAVTLPDNSVSAGKVEFNWARSDSEGGAAIDLACSASTGCVGELDIESGAVNASKVSFNYAGSASKGGAAADLVCSAAGGCVGAADIENGAVGADDVGFSYAGSASKGGAAADLVCSAAGGCVGAADIENGAVGADDVGFSYAGSASKGGAASDLACTDCVQASEVAFKYAASTEEGGAASDLACAASNGCVGLSDIENNAVGSAEIVDASVKSSDIDSTQVQRRVTGTCSSGNYVQSIAENGSVTCGTDADAGGDITKVSAGNGLTGGGTSGEVTLSVDTGWTQKRVSGKCTAGSYVREVKADGTVVCGTDATASAGTGLTKSGSTLSVDSNAVQTRVGSSCAAGSSIRQIKKDGTVTCETDTTVTAGNGLSKSGTTLNVKKPFIFGRVDMGTNTTSILGIGVGTHRCFVTQFGFGSGDIHEGCCGELLKVYMYPEPAYGSWVAYANMRSHGNPPERWVEYMCVAYWMIQ